MQITHVFCEHDGSVFHRTLVKYKFSIIEFYGVFRRIMRPPGVAPWLYGSLGTEHFDDIVLHPIGEESAGFPYYYYYYYN